MQGGMDAAIARRRETGPGATPDLMDLLLGARDPETGREMRDAELRENLLTFIVAGHETTALTLAWALYLCAFDPEVQARAREEAQGVLGATGRRGRRTWRGWDMCGRWWRRRCASIRLGASCRGRRREKDRLSAAVIRPGDTVMIPVYGLHRHRRLWEEPDAFRPDRWEAKDRDRPLPVSALR